MYQGKDIVQIKILSDRRPEGGGIAWLNKFSPPPGKLIKIVAKALSDEHVFNLEGGRATKAGTPVRAPGGYTLNPEGQPHSGLHATETVNLIIYRGEPDGSSSLSGCSNSMKTEVGDGGCSGGLTVVVEVDE